jgi:hypothetical protein
MAAYLSMRPFQCLRRNRSRKMTKQGIAVMVLSQFLQKMPGNEDTARLSTLENCIG